MWGSSRAREPVSLDLCGANLEIQPAFQMQDEPTLPVLCGYRAVGLNGLVQPVLLPLPMTLPLKLNLIG